ncbi:MAG: hypothetical protein LBJ10_02695 [Clostridiales bacterium]|jgi:RNA-binding protein YlmH|nr:hypothetical protein [Clostridiales bacterium]
MDAQKNTETLLRHMDDLAERAARSGAAHSKFLTSAEQTAAARHFRKRADVLLVMDSGIGPMGGEGDEGGEGSASAGIGEGYEGSAGARAGAAVGESLGEGAGADAGVGTGKAMGGGADVGEGTWLAKGISADAGRGTGNAMAADAAVSDGGGKSVREAFREAGRPDSDRRCVAVFVQPEWGSYDRDGILAAFEASSRSPGAIGHRDVLGALMSAGVERETIGEIIADGAPAYFVCLASVAPHIRDSISKIGRSGVRLTRIPLAQIPAGAAAAPAAKTASVASMRLDTLIGEGFGISRGAAGDLIRDGLASVNHIVCEKPDRKAECGDLLSVRGKGRIKIVSVGSAVSRKGRVFVELGVYGRSPKP